MKVEIYVYEPNKFWITADDFFSGVLVDEQYIKQNFEEIKNGKYPLPLPFSLLTFATSLISKNMKVIIEDGYIYMERNNEKLPCKDLDYALNWLNEFRYSFVGIRVGHD